MLIVKAADMRKLLSAYNKSVRVQTFKNIWKASKADLKEMLDDNFKVIAKANGKHQYKHKSGRFTKLI